MVRFIVIVCRYMFARRSEMCIELYKCLRTSSICKLCKDPETSLDNVCDRGTVSPLNIGEQSRPAHLAIHCEADRWRYLLYCLPARTALPFFQWKRPSWLKLGCKAEGTEALKQADEEILRLAQGEILANALMQQFG